MKSSEKIQHIRQAARGSLGDLERVLGEMAAPTAPVILPSYTVANLPAAAAFPGHILYCSNGAAGQPVLAFSNGTNWLRSDTRANVAAG